MDDKKIIIMVNNTFNKIYSLVVASASKSGCGCFSFGTETLVPNYKRLLSRGVYSVLLSFDYPNQLGHGNVFFVLDENKELVAVQFLDAEEPFVKIAEETHSIYGVKYMNTLESNMESDLFYVL